MDSAGRSEELTANRAAREQLGRSAYAHVCEHHEWRKVARRYVEEIEALRVGRNDRGSQERTNPNTARNIGGLHMPDGKR